MLNDLLEQVKQENAEKPEKRPPPLAYVVKSALRQKEFHAFLVEVFLLVRPYSCNCKVMGHSSDIAFYLEGKKDLVKDLFELIAKIDNEQYLSLMGQILEKQKRKERDARTS